MLTTSRRLCSIIFCRASKSPSRLARAYSSSSRGGEQRALADLVQVDLGDVVEEIRADADAPARRAAAPAFGCPARCRRRSRHRRSSTEPSFGSGRPSRRAHAGGRNFAGSTGLPRRRISKCSLTWSASVSPISAIFWPLRHLLAFLDQNFAVVRVRRQVGIVVLDDDRACHSRAGRCPRRRPCRRRWPITGCPALPAMSMPLRFALSENPAMTLPAVGHAQSTLGVIDLGHARRFDSRGRRSGRCGRRRPRRAAGVAIGAAGGAAAPRQRGRRRCRGGAGACCDLRERLLRIRAASSPSARSCSVGVLPWPMAPRDRCRQAPRRSRSSA